MNSHIVYTWTKRILSFIFIFIFCTPLFGEAEKKANENKKPDRESNISGEDEKHHVGEKEELIRLATHYYSLRFFRRKLSIVHPLAIQKENSAERGRLQSFSLTTSYNTGSGDEFHPFSPLLFFNGSLHYMPGSSLLMENDRAKKEESSAGKVQFLPGAMLGAGIAFSSQTEIARLMVGRSVPGNVTGKNRARNQNDFASLEHDVSRFKGSLTGVVLSLSPVFFRELTLSIVPAFIPSLPLFTASHKEIVHGYSVTASLLERWRISGSSARVTGLSEAQAIYLEYHAAFFHMALYYSIRKVPGSNLIYPETPPQPSRIDDEGLFLGTSYGSKEWQVNTYASLERSMGRYTVYYPTEMNRGARFDGFLLRWGFSTRILRFFSRMDLFLPESETVAKGTYGQSYEKSGYISRGTDLAAGSLLLQGPGYSSAPVICYSAHCTQPVERNSSEEKFQEQAAHLTFINGYDSSVAQFFLFATLFKPLKKLNKPEQPLRTTTPSDTLPSYMEVGFTLRSGGRGEKKLDSYTILAQVDWQLGVYYSALYRREVAAQKWRYAGESMGLSITLTL